MERLPSGTCVSDLPRLFRDRFEAFPAVYRAPSLFWHRPGYEFPGVHGRPCHLAMTDAFIAPFPVSLTDGLPLRPFGHYLSGRRAYSASLPGGAEILRFTAAFLLGLGFFSLSDLAIQPIVSSPVILGGGWRPPRASTHRCSPSAEFSLAFRR